MNQHHLKHTTKKISSIKPAYILSVALVSTTICVFALRANNEHMVKLRDVVYSADKNNTDVTGALETLQHYVTTHMNTNLTSGAGSVYPPIQLKYTYQRLLNNESAEAASANSSLYTDAQTYCQTVVPSGFSGRYRVPCIEQYVQTHDTTLTSVPEALYTFDFISPTWSPDLAGWTLIIALFSWIITLATVISGQLHKRLK
jgi:hypothetical protein